MKISQVAAAVGLPASTIRYYEKVGLVTRPDRRSGIRDYQPGAVQELIIFGLLRRLASHCQRSRYSCTAFQEARPHPCVGERSPNGNFRNLKKQLRGPRL